MGVSHEGGHGCYADQEPEPYYDTFRIEMERNSIKGPDRKTGGQQSDLIRAPFFFL